MQKQLFQRWCTHFWYCSVLSLGCKVNTRLMSQPDLGSTFHIINRMKYFGHRKLLCELTKFSKLNVFILLGYQSNTDASIFVYKHRPERTGFNMYSESTHQQLTFLALLPCINLIQLDRGLWVGQPDPEYLQDVCGNRTLATIATHDLSAVKGPLKYTALEPTSFKVEPLSGGKPIRASKV